jgi:hypothetical protein
MDGCDTGIGEILVLADASNIPGRKKDGVLGMSGDDDYEKNNKEPRRAWAVRQRQYPFLRDRIHYNSATISVALWCWLRASYFRGCCCCHCLFVFGVNSRLCADPSSGSSAKGDFSKRIGERKNMRGSLIKFCGIETCNLLHTISMKKRVVDM